MVDTLRKWALEGQLPRKAVNKKGQGLAQVEVSVARGLCPLGRHPFWLSSQPMAWGSF